MLDHIAIREFVYGHPKKPIPKKFSNSHIEDSQIAHRAEPKQVNN